MTVGEADHGELRYEITAAVGPCFEPEAEELLHLVATLVSRDPWHGAVSLTRLYPEEEA